MTEDVVAEAFARTLERGESVRDRSGYAYRIASSKIDIQPSLYSPWTTRHRAQRAKGWLAGNGSAPIWQSYVVGAQLVRHGPA